MTNNITFTARMTCATPTCSRPVTSWPDPTVPLANDSESRGPEPWSNASPTRTGCRGQISRGPSIDYLVIVSNHEDSTLLSPGATETTVLIRSITHMPRRLHTTSYLKTYSDLRRS